MLGAQNLAETDSVGSDFDQLIFLDVFERGLRRMLRSLPVARPL
jgi:hypothetical protein